MTCETSSAGPPGYGGAIEGAVGEQNPPEHETPGYEGGAEGKSELGNPPSVLEKKTRPEPDDLPIGIPVDQTE
ncbi:Hypothetical protein A7982_08240 [Minicystis rosea]|nr:Hypothetical protein A7982_08240 [Minicystis rosea]